LYIKFDPRGEDARGKLAYHLNNDMGITLLSEWRSALTTLRRSFLEADVGHPDRIALFFACQPDVSG
jgi:hypothetical protein